MNNCGDCGSCNLCGPFNFDKKKGNAALIIGIICLILSIVGIIFVFIKDSYGLICGCLSLILSITGLILAKKERKYYPRKINRYAIYLNCISLGLNLILGIVYIM